VAQFYLEMAVCPRRVHRGTKGRERTNHHQENKATVTETGGKQVTSRWTTSAGKQGAQETV
jgi:hypothetical protein